MKAITERRVLIGLVITLALLNLITIFTIFFKERSSRVSDREFTITQEAPPISGRLLRDELNFTPAQLELYRESSRELKDQLNTIFFQMNHYKELLKDQLNLPHPNDSLITNYSDSIGVAHAQIKKVTSHFYLTLKNESTPEQQKGLDQLFSPLFNDTPLNQRARLGRGAGRGERRGERDGERGWRRAL